MEKALRKLLESYNKTNLDIDKFHGKENDALQRAERLDIDSLKKRWPDNPGPHVYRLVKRIKEIIVPQKSRYS